MVFEGEYLNGIRNGKGKVYSRKDKLRYEGEFLDDKWHGKGKEYNDNSELIFEGEYLYNYKLKGKFFKNGKLEYEGEYMFYNKWHGKGYDEDGNVIYELINGNGKGKEYK